MGWWSAQRNDYRSPLVELANTTNIFKGSTKRGAVVQARTGSPSFFEGLSERRNTLRFKASAVVKYSFLYQRVDAP
jgi:hypothetical protein